MTAFDTRSLKLAKRLIDKYGKAITHYVTYEGDYNPATGKASVTTGEQTLMTAPPVAYNKGEIFISNGLIQASDIKLLIYNGDIVAPKQGDKVAIDGANYTVISVNNTWSGESIVLFELQVRK